MTPAHRKLLLTLRVSGGGHSCPDEGGNGFRRQHSATSGGWGLSKGLGGKMVKLGEKDSVHWEQKSEKSISGGRTQNSEGTEEKLQCGSMAGIC